MAQRYTRYVVRDGDGNVVQSGRVVALDRAIQEDLVGVGGVSVVVRHHLVVRLGGIFVFYPEVPPEDLDFTEFC